MKKILVTGSAGFIGFHVVRRLAGAGHRVTGVDNLNSYYDPRLKIKRLEHCGIDTALLTNGQPVESSIYPAYTFIKCDLTDERQFDEVFTRHSPDIVIHLAAQPGARTSVDKPGDYISNNIIGFFNVLEACRKSPPAHLIYASSSSIYGLNTTQPYSEEHRSDRPASLYGATKKSNELMAHAYSHLYRIPMTGLRFFTVYGPWGRPDMVYFLYTRSILEGKPIKVFNEGNMKRDFTYVDDIVDGITGVMNLIPRENTPHRVFNIGNSNPVKLLDFIQILEKILKKKAVKVMMPMQPGDVTETYADTSLLEKHCGYKPDTKPDEGLKHFVDWYMKNYSDNL